MKQSRLTLRDLKRFVKQQARLDSSFYGGDRKATLEDYFRKFREGGEL